jgi:diguanylate cyclase (GGDEF)-like protein
MQPTRYARRMKGMLAGIEARRRRVETGPAHARVDELLRYLAAWLPDGARLCLAWRNGHGAGGERGVPALSPEQRVRLLALLDGDAAEDHHTSGIERAWIDEAGTAVALAMQAPLPLEPALRERWQALAESSLRTCLLATEAGQRIQALEQSERVQKALFEITDLAGSDLEMGEMLRRVHALVGGLMYAENFYIALYDDLRDSLRFLYFVDQVDAYVADPNLELPLAEMTTSLTAALIRHGHALLGPSAQVRAQLGVARDSRHGPDSKVWMGVLMRREGRVCGAVVVQSYDSPASYSEDDRALLEFVAQHILTTIDRRHARERLEEAVAERTRELQHANQELRGEVTERERAERLQRALFRIAELSMTSDTLDEFYASVHAVVGELLDARNFYIALLDDSGQQLEFSYSVDEHDSIRATRRLSAGMTEFVLQSGLPLLARSDDIARMHDEGLVQSFGPRASCWLGVPLHLDDHVAGVIAVQSYHDANAFDTQDQELLTFVAHHVGSGLARKRAQDALREAHDDLEHRVAERTFELARANRELQGEVRERQRVEERLRLQTRQDALTGLPNRVELLQRLQLAINAMRADPSRRYAVLFMDLDRFKLVNDSVGHAAGDEMLIEAGRRLVKTLRPGDVVARLGGDEFAVLVEGYAERAEIEALTQRVLQVLGDPIWVAGRELFPTASVGIAFGESHYVSGEEVLRDADAAMYRAKASGRDRSAVFDDAMRREAIRLLDLEADLRRALIADAFEPYYQPIVRLADGVVLGHEALLRWRQPGGEVRTPADFLGVAETSGLIEQIDWQLYAKVATRLAQEPAGYISVNVAPNHLRVEDFADRLLGLLDAAKADASRLRIEITEVALLDDAPRILRTLRRLRDRGVLAQLDDFGTGFSALSYLHRFPISALKIDRSFVAELAGEARTESLALIRAILALAATLDIETVGEGIENESQRLALHGLGCMYGQGYLFGRPQALLKPFAKHYR